MRLGQTASLKSLNFWWLDSKVASTLEIMVCNFFSSTLLTLSWLSWIVTGAPKNLKVLVPVKGMVCPHKDSWGHTPGLSMPALPCCSTWEPWASCPTTTATLLCIQQGLASSWLISQEGGVICVLQEVALLGCIGEGVAQMR